MGKVSSLRQQLIFLVEKELVKFDEDLVYPGRWGIPDLRMDIRLAYALKKWMEEIPREVDRFVQEKRKDKNLFSFLGEVKLAINSAYRPVLFGITGDKDGKRDLSDPRGHWCGLSVDIGMKETAMALWGNKAFCNSVSEEFSYASMKEEYKSILVGSASSAGLDRVFLHKGEWWHFSFDDKRVRNPNFVWNVWNKNNPVPKFYEENLPGIRPSKNIRVIRWDILMSLGEGQVKH